MDAEPDHNHDEDDDIPQAICFGCSGEMVPEMEVIVTEPCPDVLGNIHSWHFQCYMCHKLHGAFINLPRCEAPAS